MNRIDEIAFKHDQVRGLLKKHHTAALWLTQTRNIAWMTAGADASIPVDSDAGAYSLLVSADSIKVLTTNIEATRLRAEEKFESLGFEFQVFPWYSSGPDIPGDHIADTAIADDMLALRLVLTSSEQERFRALGKETADALDEAIRAVRPGDTEYMMAGRLAAACRARGGIAVVNLVATDERISQFRHPLPTGKTLEKYAMIVVCNRKGGLVVAGTRLAHFGPLPAELAEKAQKVAVIDAAAMVATRPGRSHADVFKDLQAAYAAQGEADQWQNHHQGGPAGYNSREFIVTPDNDTPVQAGVAYAWNPSIVGCKSEDTILVQDDTFEIVSQADDNWPMIEVDIAGQSVKRPGIIEM